MDSIRRIFRDRNAVFALGLFILLALVMNRPLSTALQRGVADSGDSMLSSWILAWDCHQIVGGKGSLFDANIFHPHRNTLAYSEHLLGEAIWAWPLYLLGFTPAGLNNGVLLMAFVLNGFVPYLVARSLLGNAGAGFIAGCLYAYSPFRYCQLGHLQVEFVFWTPALVYFLIRYGQTGRTASALGVAVCYWQQAWSNSYLLIYLLYPTVAIFIWLFVRWCLRRRRILWKHMIGWFLVTIPLIYTALPYYKMEKEIGLDRSREAVEYYSANLFSYLSAPTLNQLYGKITWEARRGGPGAYLFPGLVALVLFIYAGFDLWPGPQRADTSSERHDSVALKQILKFLWVSVLITVVLAMGPRIYVGAVPLLRGPAYLIYKILPGFDGLRANHRWHLVTLALIIFPAAYGFLRLKESLSRTRWRKWGGTRLALLVSGLVLVEGYSAPLPQVNLHPKDRAVPPVYTWMGHQPGDFAIAEYPIGGRGNLDFRYMYYSRYHWKSLVNGKSRAVPPDHSQLLRKIRDPAEQEAIRWFRKNSVRFIILHGSPESPRGINTQLLNRLEASPAYRLARRFGEDSVWKVVPRK